MDWIVSYLPQVLMAVGVIALIVEVVVLGFATFIFFFIGLSLVISGFCMYMGWIDATIHYAIWTNIILTIVFAAVLWRPFKQLQNRQTKQNYQSDFAQQTFVLKGNVDANTDDVTHAYSGIQWKVRSEQPLMEGQKVKVVKMEVGIMWVEAINE
ncbi:MAG TPA: activity regulator of membrane protease YbbK [Vibrio sp.]|uniref:NfeD family protein n=1 Tax=Vibrio TaxID=662 RepID=UPI00040489FC|nr:MULTISPECIES: NfeD family protein [Vibrio]HCH01602.1 activity regulator of membrane protease YbbK [Vibrio sp.]